MTWGLTSSLLGAMFALVCPSPTAVAAAPAPATIAVPGVVLHAVRDRGRVYTAAGPAGVQIVDLAAGRVVAGHRFDGDAPVDVIDVADGVVHAVTGRRETTTLHALFAKDASPWRSVPLGDIGYARWVVSLAADRAAVVTGGEVLFVDVEAGRVTGSVRIEGGIATGAVARGDDLLVSRSYAGGVVVIDPATATVRQVIETPDWLIGVSETSGQAWVTGTIEGLGRVDLATGAWTRVAAVGQIAPHELLARADGGAEVLDGGALVSLDAMGAEQGRVRLPTGVPATVLVAVDGPEVITAGAGGLAVWTREVPDA